MDGYQIEIARGAIRAMKEDALPDDEVAWRLIRKYERLLKEAIAEQENAA